MRFQVEEQNDRPTWGNGLEFLMSCIAMSVGLGNIWRFPFTAYENGGGAFLIPYIIVLILIGKPIYYMEMSLGQFSSRSSVKVWKLSPLFKGQYIYIIYMEFDLFKKKNDNLLVSYRNEIKYK